MPIPNDPVLFVKPRTALNGPFPAKVNVPGFAQDGTSDYEAEVSLVISKDGRDIKKEDAMDYVLGYTSSNDVSARKTQWLNSQWCFSKGKADFQVWRFEKACSIDLSGIGLDGSAPIGPVLVAPSAIGDPHALDIKAIHNGNVVQDSNTRYVWPRSFQ